MVAPTVDAMNTKSTAATTTAKTMTTTCNWCRRKTEHRVTAFDRICRVCTERTPLW